MAGKSSSEPHQDDEFALEAGAVEVSTEMPVLRRDLRVTRKNGRVEVLAPEKGTAFELYDTEWAVAGLMDGTRTYAQVARDALSFGVGATAATVASFERELRGYGFLEQARNGNSNALVKRTRSEPEYSHEERTLLDTAAALRTRGDRAGASNYLLAVLEINPHNQTALELLRSVESDETALVPAEVRDLTTTFDADVVEDDEDVHDGALVEYEDDLESDEMEEQELARALSRGRARRKFRMWVLGAVGAGVLLLVLGLIPWPFKVNAELTIESLRTRSVQSPMGAIRVEKVLVTEGQRVEEGAILVQLDTGDLESKMAAAVARERQEEARLERLKNGSSKLELERAKKDVAIRASSMRFAARELKRIRAAGDLVSRSERSEAARAFEVAKNEHERAKVELKLLRAGSRKELIRAQQALMDEAQASLKLAREKLEMLTVRAPISGTVITENPDELVGEVVELGTELVRLSDDSEVTAVFEIRPNDVGHASVGAPVEFWLVSDPEQTYDAELSFVASSATMPEDRRPFYRAKATVKNPAKSIRPGMKGFARIRAEDRSVLWILMRPFVSALRRFRASLPFYF